MGQHPINRGGGGKNTHPKKPKKGLEKRAGLKKKQKKAG